MLNTTQPGISNGIRRLEQELGVDLLTRKGKRLGVTPAGERIVTLARETLHKVESIERAAEEFLHEDRGSLRIATTHTQARYVLPEHIQNFRQKYPNVSLHINQGTPAQLAELTLNGEVDFAIATEGFEYFTSLILAPCYTWNRSIVVPKRHPLSRVDKITLADVAREPLVTYVFWICRWFKCRECIRCRRTTRERLVYSDGHRCHQEICSPWGWYRHHCINGEGTRRR